MNQFQIAAGIVPCALRAANAANENPVDAGTMIALSGALSTAVSVYGEKNRKAMIKAALQVTQDFEILAEDFFDVLEEAPAIATLARSKNYQEIAEFIIENKELSRKERFQLYADEYEAPGVKFWKGFRIVCLSLTILCAAAGLCLYFFDPERRQKFLENLEELKKRASEFRKHLAAFGKAVKFLIHQITK